MTKTTKFLAGAALAIVAMLVATPSAQATSITYNLTSDHCTGGCGPVGTIFGTVTLDDFGGSSVQITVHLNSPYVYAKTGAADNQAFKFNAVGVVAGDITIAPHPPQTLVVTTGALNGDGTGNFGFGIECTSCGGGLSGAFSADIVFTVANATIAELTVPNNLGNVFVADVGNPTTGNTGPIDATTPTTVPEPLTLTLLGFGVLGLGAGMRRRMVK